MHRSKIKGILWFVFVSFFFLFSDSYIGFVLLIFTLVLSVFLYLITILTRKKIETSIQTVGTINKEEVTQFIIKVKNNSVFPISKLSLPLIIKNHLTGEETKKVIEVALSGKTEELLSVDLMSNYCGKITIQIDKIMVYDFLGMFSKESKKSVAEDVYVLPNTFGIDIIDNFEQSTDLDLTNEQAESKGINQSDIIGISEYTPGDNLKHIHWKLTSKFDELIVKEFSKPINHSYIVLLETRIHENNKKKSPAVTDAIMEAFISISQSLIKTEKTHSIGWFNNEMNDLQIEEIHSIDQLTHLFKILLTIEQRKRNISVIEHYFNTVGHDSFSHVIYINSALTGSTRINNEWLRKASILTCYEMNDLVANVSEREVQFTPMNMKQQLEQLVV